VCGVRLATVQGTCAGYGLLINRFEDLGEQIKSLFTFIMPVRFVSAAPIADGVIDTGIESVDPSCRWRRRRGVWLLLVLWALLVPLRAMAGTWTALTHQAPGTIGTMLLLTDGSVIAQQSNVSGNWYRLTPDTNGSYITGTWTTLASAHYTRLYYSSDVLRDGRVFVAGGEYGTGSLTAEAYNPVSNTWTTLPASGQDFIDSGSKLVANGNVLVAPVFPSPSGSTIILLPASNTWSNGPALVRGSDQDEASWVKLPDDSILTIDPYGMNSERYIPAQNQWVDDATLSVDLWSTNFEEGAGVLLYTGQALFLGGNGHTALYTPSGTTSPGTWTTGPNIPNGLGTPDAPAAVMVNGNVLCAVGPAQTYNGPTSFYEYNPASNSFTQVNGPTGTTYNNVPYDTRMLDLPDGTVLFSSGTSRQLYEYQPTGSPLAAAVPTITNITQNVDGSYLLTGTLLNGISEGAAYGDDAQMDSNYPIIRMTAGNGRVYFARTFNWSSTGVMTGTNLVTTEFTVPAGPPVGTYALVVVANGISSLPFPFQISQTPSIPTNLTATAVGANQINLAWAGSSGATGYIVNRDGSPVATTATNGYSDTGLMMGTNYCYTVAATNSVGTSSNSTSVCATTFTGTTNADLLAYWTFDEGGGSIAFDYSGNNNMGTVVIGGGNWTSGMVNGGLFFDGQFTQMTASNSPSLNPINGITIAVWVNQDGTCWCDPARIVEKGVTDNQYGLLIDGSSNLEFMVAGVTNGTLSTAPPSVNAWHHLAGTYDGSVISLYIDGQLATQQVASGTLTVTTNPLAVGNRPGNSSPVDFFTGTVDDVRIYGSALTPAQISQLYSTDSVGDGIPNWWRQQYFATSSSTDATSCAACDLDGTGQNNLFKYVAGLDPTDPTSVFVLTIASVTNQTAQENLFFNPIATGRTYTVQYSTDLVSGVWLPLTTYTGPQTNGNQVTITDTNAVLPQEFYRIDISLP
jgi:hypothetical protein